MDARGDALPVVSALMGELDWLYACGAPYLKVWRAKVSYLFTIKVISELSNGTKCLLSCGCDFLLFA